MAKPAAKYTLGRTSKSRLKGVHPDLVRVIKRAIQITDTDFSVIVGTRTEETQRKRYESGKSQTLNSRHLPKVPKHAPELGAVSHAVDLAGWVGSASSWDICHLCDIADAIRTAAIELNVSIEWGGCWDALERYADAPDAMMAYLQRKKTANEKPFIDAGHFQLSWEAYPV
ncbi:hypothetical protein QKW35_20490 [Pontibacterium granulatum]|uniref:hypothetical protein n=1 Tax=Pontibacterium granulatum TaxID=2036029 RepID=UPI00249B985E|nr:hypothetical protein [Pontibacterium granulatum]MDI3326762.1 hypothetical protein [Pontibacterium granulatum]